MSVQVSTRIDPHTKEEFDKICAMIGTSPSNALGILIKGMVNYKGFPFAVTAMPVAEPQLLSKTARPTIDELFAGYVQDGNDEEVDWGEPVGAEVW